MLHLKQDRFTICFQTSILGGGGEFTILWCQGYLTDRQTDSQIDHQTDRRTGLATPLGHYHHTLFFEIFV